MIAISNNPLATVIAQLKASGITVRTSPVSSLDEFEKATQEGYTSDELIQIRQESIDRHNRVHFHPNVLNSIINE